MLPLDDNMQARHRPWVTASLCLLLAAIHGTLALLPEAKSAEILAKFAFIPVLFGVAPWHHMHSLATATYLHADLWHLLGNLWFLWIFGRRLEGLFGAWFLLFAFPLAGAVGYLLHWIFEADSRAITLGASGAISTALGAYLVLFPRVRLKILFFFGWVPKTVEFPAFVFLVFWGVLECCGLAASIFGSSSIAYAAHVGGFVLGIASAMAWKTSTPFAEERLIAYLDSMKR